MKWMNEWIIYWSESIISIFDKKNPLFVYFVASWLLFGHFYGAFLIRLVSMIPWLLNWVFFWIESLEPILNWMIVWIEFLVSNIESYIELNHSSAKLKHWNESDRVLPTPNGCANQKGGLSLVIGARVGHSVSVYADSFGYAHIYIFEKKKQKCADIQIFPIF